MTEKNPENVRDDILIRVFPHRNHWTPTDELSFVGFPPLFLDYPRSTPVKISVTFTWHRELAEKIALSWSTFFNDVQIGGPAYGDPGGEFTPGRFLKEGCTITSRGCPKKCGWCVVPAREGAIRELKIHPGWIVQDNNLLACSEHHLQEVFRMLKDQNRNIFFNGGLDKHFLKEWHRELFDTIKIGELWFACDTKHDLPALQRAAKILQGIPIKKLRCYTMLGYEGESLYDAQMRVERVLELGFMPFSQLYQSDTFKSWSLEWKQLNKKWARPAAYMAKPTGGFSHEWPQQEVLL